VDAGVILNQINLSQEYWSFLQRMANRPAVALTELLLIGIVIYAILRFFQGTRGARLVRAVLTILAVSFAFVWLIAEQLESERIKLLYPYFIFVVFLVSLVAFQTELRRMLLRLGEGGYSQRWFKASERVIDPVVIAVERLSKKKIGALIAIERVGEIGAVLESGVRMDAKVSAELLETIFWPGTPLHDLGVIIQQGRMVAAGCQFPLAESGEVERSLGSRHRAGLGLSHEAQAVVIIVSEETGRVSLAVRGKLEVVTPETLRRRLAEELQVTSDQLRQEVVVSDKADNTKPRIAHDGTGQAA